MDPSGAPPGKSGVSYVIGIDEVGRGALAGDVFTCGVLAPVGTRPVEGVTDSKQLSAHRREQLHAVLTECPDIRWHVARRPASLIDAVGIDLAVRECFEECIDRLLGTGLSVAVIQVDGNRPSGWAVWPCPCEFIPKGDALVWAIGAASIIAKVERDAYMKEEGAREPWYDWRNNMGYGTPAHLQGIGQNGLSPIHRKRFCKRFVKDGDGGILDLFTGP